MSEKLIKELASLHTLYKDGAISEDEFKTLKENLIQSNDTNANEENQTLDDTLEINESPKGETDPEMVQSEEEKELSELISLGKNLKAAKLYQKKELLLSQVALGP